MTYAPPEQSEPAITSSRPWTMLAGGEGLGSAPGASKDTFTRWISIPCEVLRGTTWSRWVRGEETVRYGQDRNLEIWGRQSIT